MAARLIIVRHGNTFDRGEPVLRVGGRTDLDLSTSGMAQARALAAHLASRDFAPQHMLVGPLVRTRQTADAIVEALNEPISPVIDERLREIDYGPDEGRPEDEVVARLGAPAIEAWETRALVPDGWRVDPDALRVAWRDILAEAARRGGDTMAVTSNGVARFALQECNVPPGVPLKLRTAAYGVITAEPGRPSVSEWDVRAPAD